MTTPQDDDSFSTPLLEFMESRREDARGIDDLNFRAIFLLDTLGLSYGIITELGARTFLESAGIEITDEIKSITTQYHTAGALEIVERYALNSIVGIHTGYLSHGFEQHLDKLKYDGVFFREQLVPSL